MTLFLLAESAISNEMTQTIVSLSNFTMWWTFLFKYSWLQFRNKLVSFHSSGPQSFSCFVANLVCFSCKVCKLINAFVSLNIPKICDFKVFLSKKSLRLKSMSTMCLGECRPRFFTCLFFESKLTQHDKIEFTFFCLQETRIRRNNAGTGGSWLQRKSFRFRNGVSRICTFGNIEWKFLPNAWKIF